MRFFHLLRRFMPALVAAGGVLVLAVGCAQPAGEPAAPASAPVEKPTITLGEGNWTSQQVMTEIFDQVISNELGYKTERVFGYGPIIWAAMDKGEVDIAPEIWYPARQGEIQPFLDKGTVELAGEVFGGAGNWMVVPRYVVEGDPARGIAPMAPDLKTIPDLAKYWDLFENPENPGKGEIVGGEVGWANEAPWIIEGYELPFYMSNQSEAIMMARTVAAYKRGDPIVVVWWSPHVIFSQVDLIKLESVDPDRTGEIDWDAEPSPLKTGMAEYTVYKVARADLANTAPDVYRLTQTLSVTEDEINALTFRVDVDEEKIPDVVADWISKNPSKVAQWLGK